MTPGDSELQSHLEGLPGWQAGRVLDLRSGGDFRFAHLRGAVSHPLPPDADPSLDLPSIFLPPREQPLLVVADTGQWAATVARHLADRGRARVDGVQLTREDLEALPTDMVYRGEESGHLWEPPRWLLRHADLLPPPTAGPVMDLGCGSGRASVWLAARGYSVTGYDHLSEALELGRRLAGAVGCRCRWQEADLRRPKQWPAGDWAVLLAFRFLQRDLLAAMADRLIPGGVALVRTFRLVPGHKGPPARRHCLAPGELAEFFPDHRFEILAGAEDADPDGRPAAGIVARRRP